MMLCKQEDEDKAAKLALDIISSRSSEDDIAELERKQEEKYEKIREEKKEVKRPGPKSPAPKRPRSERTKPDGPQKKVKQSGNRLTADKAQANMNRGSASDIIKIISDSGSLNPVKVAMHEIPETNSSIDPGSVKVESSNPVSNGDDDKQEEQTMDEASQSQTAESECKPEEVQQPPEDCETKGNNERTNDTENANNEEKSVTDNSTGDHVCCNSPPRNTDALKWEVEHISAGTTDPNGTPPEKGQENISERMGESLAQQAQHVMDSGVMSACTTTTTESATSAIQAS